MGSSLRTDFVQSTTHAWNHHDYMGTVTQNDLASGAPVSLMAFVNQRALGPAPAARVGPGPSSY